MAEDLVEVAFVGDEVQAAMIEALLESNGIPSMQEQVGPSGRQLNSVLLSPGGTRRVMVHAHRAQEARALLAEAEAEGEREAPESVNARYLEEEAGWRRLRRHGVLGAFAGMLAVTVAAIALTALAFAIFLLLRAV